MRLNSLPFRLLKMVHSLALALLFISLPLLADTPSVNDEPSVLGRQVLELLQTHDADRFSTNVAASIQNWRSVQSTNTLVKGDDPLNSAFEKHLERQRKSIAESARIVLAHASRLGFDSKQVHFTFKEVLSSQLGTTHSSSIQAEGEDLPWLRQAIVVLQAERIAGAQTNSPILEQCELTLAGITKFPAGWRVDQGIRWLRFPPGVEDAKMRHELELLTKIERNSSISGADDPAMAALGNSLGRFIQKKDERIFISEAFRSMDEYWAMYAKKHASDKPAPNRKVEEASWRPWRDGIVESARGVLAQLNQHGIDFADAKLTVKQVEVEQSYQYLSFGQLEGTDGHPLKVVFDVDSKRKSRTGRPIAGEYVLMSKRVERTNNRWVVEGDLWWAQFPAGLLDEKEQKNLEVENYVRLNGHLPPGSELPNIEFVRLDNQNKLKLSDFKGKILVLDIWATWCAPCQEPMAKLQQLAASHPEWKGKVEVASLSIDDDLATAQKHINKRGWTNSFNLWAGHGGYQSIPARQFRIYGVPTLYIIDTDGKVVTADHPLGMPIEELVDQQLNESKNPQSIH